MSVSVSAQLPIVKIAAGAVIVLCIVAVGAMTGVIPTAGSKEDPAAAAEKPAHRGTKESAKPASAAQPAKREQAAAPVCGNCGVVQAIKPVEIEGEGTGLGAVAGAVAGIVVGNQIGDGNGRKLARVAGAAGGAYAGHQIEKNVRKAVEYEVVVRMDDGSQRMVKQKSKDGLSEGARARIVDGVVVQG